MRFVLIFATLAIVPAAHAQQHGGMAMPAADPASKALIQHSTPSDGAMMHGSPKSFTVTFVRPTELRSVTLADDTDTEIALTARPVQTDGSSASIALPPLDPSTYRLGWSGVSQGQDVSGSITFMVH